MSNSIQYFRVKYQFDNIFNMVNNCCAFTFTKTASYNVSLILDLKLPSSCESEYIAWVKWGLPLSFFIYSSDLIRHNFYILNNKYVYASYLFWFFCTYLLNCNGWLLIFWVLNSSYFYINLFPKLPSMITLCTVVYDISVLTMCIKCIYHDYCVYQYKSTELVFIINIGCWL